MPRKAKPYSKFEAEHLQYINDSPQLFGLLYDLNILPETLKQGGAGWGAMLRIAYEAKTRDKKVYEELNLAWNMLIRWHNCNPVGLKRVEKAMYSYRRAMHKTTAEWKEFEEISKTVFKHIKRKV